MTPEELVKKYIPEKPLVDVFDKRLIVLAKSRMGTLNDYLPMVMPWFSEFIPSPLGEQYKDLLDEFYVFTECVSGWSPEIIQEFIRRGEKKYWKFRGKGLTVLFSGKEYGLPIADMLFLIGYYETQERINKLYGN
jgi:hypothetical protein